MDESSKIELAEKLSGELTGVDRNELSKWINFLKTEKSLDKAINLAKQLSISPMLRSVPQRSYERIYETINRKKGEFQKVTLDELLEILGYIRLMLVGETASLKGTLKVRKTPKRGFKRGVHENALEKASRK